MRGLPPPPEDVMGLHVTWEYNSFPSCSSTFWMYSLDSNSATQSDLITFLGDWQLGPLNALLAVLPSVVSAGLLRLTSYGGAIKRVVTGSTGFPGALSGAIPLNAALVLTWSTGESGKGLDGHTWLPLAGEMMSPDGKRLNTDEWTNAVDASIAYINAVLSITPPWLQPVKPVVVNRQEDGRPLTQAGFQQILYGGASPFAGTMNRRGGKSGPISSSF